MHTSLTAGGALSLLICLCSSAQADVPALTFPSGSGTIGHANNSATTLGWTFDVSSSLTVTALGYYDDLGDGLLEAHDVGVFDSSGALLASATVGAGTSAPLVATVRYTSIAPLVLAPGAYTIGGTIGATAADRALFFLDSPAFKPGISAPAASSRYTEAGSYTALTYPDLNWVPANFYLGPDFEVSVVPEPLSSAMLVCGLCAIANVTRRSTRKLP